MNNCTCASFFTNREKYKKDCPQHSPALPIGWTPSLSPSQEWRLHNGEGKVPEWFLRFCDRIRKETLSQERGKAALKGERNRIIEQIRAEEREKIAEMVEGMKIMKSLGGAADSVCLRCGFPNDHRGCQCTYNQAFTDASARIREGNV